MIIISSSSFFLFLSTSMCFSNWCLFISSNLDLQRLQTPWVLGFALRLWLFLCIRSLATLLKRFLHWKHLNIAELFASLFWASFLLWNSLLCRPSFSKEDDWTPHSSHLSLVSVSVSAFSLSPSDNLRSPDFSDLSQTSSEGLLFVCVFVFTEVDEKFKVFLVLSLLSAAFPGPSLSLAPVFNWPGLPLKSFAARKLKGNWIFQLCHNFPFAHLYWHVASL